MRLRIRLFLIMMMPTFIGSSLYGMPPADEEPGTEDSSSKKRKAPHSDFNAEASDEEIPSLKKPKTTEENNEDFIAIPPQMDAPLNTLPPDVLRQVLPHLTSSEGWRLMLTGNKRLCLAMNSAEMNLAWKAWYVREKNPKANAFAPVITSWQRLYSLTRDLENVFKTLTFDEDEFFQKLSQVTPAEGPMYLYVQALLREHNEKEVEAFELYQRAAEQNFKPAQNMVAKALYEGKLGQGVRSEQVRFDELKALAAKDCERAQDSIAEALYKGGFGQDERPEQERFDELKSFADKGWERAQHYVAETLYYRILGQNTRSEQDRFDILKSFADQGWERAQYCVVQTLYYGDLGQDIRPEQDRYDTLKVLAAQGWKSAQNYIAEALYLGDLGQDERPEQDRFDELKSFAAQGRESAQHYVTQALYYGVLDQKEETEQERFDELKSFAAQGRESAQRYVVQALCYGELGQDIRPEQDRFDELQTLAAQGWKSAQYYVMQTLGDERLGQTRDEECLRKLPRVQWLLEFFVPR